MNATPETDRAKFDAANYRDEVADYVVRVDFARKLERERDEALSECERLEIMTAEKAAELHQLRAVCDELATAFSSNGLHWISNADECVVCKTLEAYNSLPHVKAKGKL